MVLSAPSAPDAGDTSSRHDVAVTHHRPPPPRGSGDGWVTLSSGRVKWGLFGAAGMLLRHEDSLLLARRSEWVHGGNGQWSVPGGAIDKDELPVDAALREFDEEDRKSVV